MDEQSLSSSEINIAVARKLGWKYAEPWHGKNELPDYCHDIKAAWEMVDWLKANQYTVEIKVNGLTNSVGEVELDTTECWIQHAFERSRNAEADITPMAICLAFLKLKKETQ